MSHLESPTSPQAAIARAASPVLDALALREDIESMIETRIEDLRELLPRLRVRRAFFGGAWVLGLHVGGRHGDGGAFSRLDFELGIDAETQVTLGVRTTIRGRDELRKETTVSMNEEKGRSALTTFVEEAFLAFAERYFTFTKD